MAGDMIKRNIFSIVILISIFSINGLRPVLAEDITTDDIIQLLKPKPKTRGLSGPQITPEESSFLDTVRHKTRGLTIEDRTELNQIVEHQKMPAINLEVNFTLNSASLDPTAVNVLQKLGAALSSNELRGATFLVAGHTDGRGAKDYNQRLSESRAASVRTFLANNFNIPIDGLIIVGYGQEQLKNQSDPYADENRRVQIVNLGKN